MIHLIMPSREEYTVEKVTAEETPYLDFRGNDFFLKLLEPLTSEENETLWMFQNGHCLYTSGVMINMRLRNLIGVDNKVIDSLIDKGLLSDHEDGCRLTELGEYVKITKP